MSTTESTLDNQDSTETFDYESIKALAKALCRPASTLYALSDACDPFYMTPGRQTAARWFAEVWDRYAPAGEVHLRRLHYVLISAAQPPPKRPGARGDYQNTEREWHAAVDAATGAREMGLVPAGRIVDRRAGEPAYVFVPDDEDCDATVWVDDIITRPPRQASRIEIAQQNYQFPRPPTFEVTPPEIAEPYALEMWIEKSTMNDVLDPIARARDVTFVPGVGELSYTHCQWLIERVLAHGRATRILYISDFDPAGVNMPVSIARKIEFIIARDGLDLDIRLDPLVLTAKQVQRYGLPRTPIKDTDIRKANFEAHNGEGAVELDALEGLHPGELAKIVNKAIDMYRAPAIATRREIVTANNELMEQCDAARDDVLAEHQVDIEELRQKFAAMRAVIAPHEAARAALAEEFAARIAEHDDAINTAVDEFHDQAEATFAEIAEDLEAAAPDPDDIDWPEGYVADESDQQLYQSDRDYLTQIEFYKAYQGKPTGRRPPGSRAATRDKIEAAASRRRRGEVAS